VYPWRTRGLVRAQTLGARSARGGFSQVRARPTVDGPLFRSVLPHLRMYSWASWSVRKFSRQLVLTCYIFRWTFRHMFLNVVTCSAF